MATRVTQASKPVIAANSPASVRATQVSRIMVPAADTSPRTARVTQVSRVIVATVQIAGGGGDFMLKGIGA